MISKTAIGNLETIGTDGKIATLILHWQASSYGQQCGLAFQTTELIPYDEDNEELIKQDALKRFEQDLSRSNTDSFLQGGLLNFVNGKRFRLKRT